VRVFIAVPLSQAFKQALSDACATLRGSRPGLRWTRPEGMHVTLAFLGDIGERGLQGAIMASRGAVQAAAVAGMGAGFMLSARGLVTFPPQGQAAVIAAGIGDGATQTILMAEYVERELERIGAESGVPFRPRERRPFLPHITLARANRPGVIISADERATSVACSCLVNAIVLYSSELGNAGPRYEVLEWMALR
jgi:2'-5' RNA ligase